MQFCVWFIIFQIATVWRIVKTIYGEEYVQNSLNAHGCKNNEDTVSHTNIPAGNLALASLDHSTDNERQSRGKKYWINTELVNIFSFFI